MSSSKLILAGESNDTLTFSQDFVLFEKGPAVEKNQLVFVKYGRTYSLNNYNDYAGLNVKGKTVLRISGQPTDKDNPEYFIKTVSNWRRSASIVNLAQQNGANRIIVLINNYWISRRVRLKEIFASPSIDSIDEEKGLPGCEYITDYEYINDKVVNINLDMVGRESEGSLCVIGSERISNEFYDIVEIINKDITHFVFDYTYDTPYHTERLFYRNDQWNFARKNIPVVFFTVCTKPIITNQQMMPVRSISGNC